MSKVHLVQCCFGAEIEKTVGPYADKEDAKAVANAIEEHFYSGGDQHIHIDTRVVK